MKESGIANRRKNDKDNIKQERVDKIKENRAIRFAPISGNELRKLPLYQLYVYFSKEAGSKWSASISLK